MGCFVFLKQRGTNRHKSNISFEQWSIFLTLLFLLKVKNMADYSWLHCKIMLTNFCFIGFHWVLLISVSLWLAIDCPFNWGWSLLRCHHMLMVCLACYVSLTYLVSLLSLFCSTFDLVFGGFLFLAIPQSCTNRTQSADWFAANKTDHPTQCLKHLVAPRSSLLIWSAKKHNRVVPREPAERNSKRTVTAVTVLETCGTQHNITKTLKLLLPIRRSFPWNMSVWCK